MILCAALRFEAPDFKPTGELIVPCWRHGFGYSILRDLAGDKYKNAKITEGFITTDNVFLDRKKALEHALRCHQLPQSVRWHKQDHNEIELYSEDLY